jgi:CheY-like chemotaxis protein
MMNEPAFGGEVLLCEDNEMNQTLICKRLAKAGLKTVVAENGKKGVETVISRIQKGVKPFDLIFMDIYMPVMDGFEATAEISSLNTGTPIIALTASSDPGEREQYFAHGMSDCMSKPFTSEELLACLVKYLKPKTFVSMNLETVYPGSRENRLVDNMRSRQNVNPVSDDNLKIKLIKMFIKNNKTIYNVITKAIDDRDIILAHRLAHTLKSNAGMLGKASLQRAANDVENFLAIEMNTGVKFDPENPVMNVLVSELEAVIKEFELFLANTALSEKKNHIDTKHKSELLGEKEAMNLIDELEILLDGGNTECMNLIGSLRSIPESDGSLVNELIHQIEYFEFDLAKGTIVKLKEKLLETSDD